MKKTVQTIVVTIALSGIPTAVLACGMCGFEMLEYGLPHSLIWAHGTAIWFFTVMLLTSAENHTCRFFEAIIFVFLAYFIGFGIIGPCAFMLLGFIAFCFTLQGCFSKVRQKMSKGSRTGLMLVSVAVLFAVPTGCSISARTRENRSDADFILSWGGYRSKGVLHKLISDPEQYEDQLRKILAQTEDEDMAEQAASALATLEEERAEAATDTQVDPSEEQGEQ